MNLGDSNFLCIIHPSLIQKVYAARPKKFVRMKKMDYVIQQAVVHGVFNAEGEDWKLHRSIITKGLDIKHQREFIRECLWLLNVCIRNGRKIPNLVFLLTFNATYFALQSI
ncbi:MAG: cytochrome P450 [Crocinitomicaceae bacterium]